MPIVLDGTNGINTPDLESAGPISGTTGTFSGALQASGVVANIYPLVSGTAVASTSGTSIDFTSIPSWVKRVTVMLRGVQLSGASSPLVQIGNNTPTTTGYLSATTFVFNNASSGSFSATNGFPIFAGGAANINNSQLVITEMGSNSWISSHNGNMTNLAISVNGGGSVTLGSVLNMVRITTANGTDTFVAGSINILYE